MTYSDVMQAAVRLVEGGKRSFTVEEARNLTVNERLELCSVIRHHAIIEKYGFIPAFERVARVKTLMDPEQVVAVRPLPDFKLAVKFIDGLQGVVDMRKLIHSDDAGVFAALKDVTVFNAVDINFGDVAWPGDIDLAPDRMYAEIRKNGEWIVS